MLDLIGVIYFTYVIGKKAAAKGQPVLRWRIFHVIAWICFEFLGLALGLRLIGTQNFIALNLFAVFCAFGGYLLVRYLLERVPDANNNDGSADR